MKKYYSLREISSELDIPKSTVVKYKDYFSDFLPMSGKGKRKKFGEESLEILATIRKCREEDNLDWLEIKDLLSEKYGEPPEDPGTSLSRETPGAVEPRSKQIEHVLHLVNAVATEVIRISGSVSEVRERTRKHGDSLDKIAGQVARTERNMEMVMADLLERDGQREKSTKKIMQQVHAEFEQVNKRLKALAAEMASAGNGSEKQARENMELLKKRIDTLVEESVLQKGKYNTLKRENEELHRKLRERRSERESSGTRQEETRKSGGFFSRLLGR